ncbi:SRPBCC domain-containing protein [Nonomuraea sp. NPDC048916]|uniref:CoxG family protein n=1 Tax=Nonomuraea sp. NPDC048916 TaxID=3154232 RepID=UPI0033F29994
MIIQQDFTVRAPRDMVAEFLTDIASLRQCVPGLEDVEEIEPDRYRGTLRLHVGPIKTSFQGEISLDRDAAPVRLIALGRGRDRGSGTSVQVSFTAYLVESADGATTVTAVADIVLRGRLAQFGSGVIKATAEEVVRDFAREVNMRLGAAADLGREGAAAESDGLPPAAEEASRRLTARMVIGIALRSLWHRLTRRLRRPASADQVREL